MIRTLVASTLLLAGLRLGVAHRTLGSGMSCGKQFSTPEDALTIPNPLISWASYRMLSCDAPIFWMKGEMLANQNLEFTAGNPTIERFKDARISVVIIGPGMDQLTDEQKARVPTAVTDNIGAGEGAQLFESPEDQSSCAHLKSEEMQAASDVRDGRCHFHEEYGNSHSWTVLDEQMHTKDAGMYRFALFNAAKQPVKFWFACCDWPEDFQTEFDIPEVDCPYCGAKGTFGRWASLFQEQKSMAKHAGFPALQDCTADPGPPADPTPEQCPKIDDDTKKQPESCKLGCSKGECHSHNIFGECEYLVDWIIPHPQLNGNNISKMILFKGDKVKFKRPFSQNIGHNMYDMKTQDAMDKCDFLAGPASELANTEDITAGETVTFEKAGHHFFSCGIGCVTHENDHRTEHSSWCHCQLGQVLHVEVKDSSEGMRCHDHAFTGKKTAGCHDGHCHDDEADAAMTCEEGQTLAMIAGSENYGASSEGAAECSQMCAPTAAMQWMAGVEAGSCADAGFGKMIEKKQVQPAGSPMKIEVMMMGKDAASGNLACEDGETLAMIAGSENYGAADETQCSQMCAPTAAMQWMAGVEAGECAMAGFTEMVEKKDVQPAGSPMKISVVIMAKGAANHGLTCEEGETLAMIAGSENYGAAGAHQCTQMCAPTNAMQWMAGVEEGECAMAGFTEKVEAKDVQPAGSPMKISVAIMGKGNKVSATCHCHSYEEIQCDASGDALYDEHIDEIKEHCQGVLDGTDKVCPYKCFQPMEILDITYLDCGDARQPHELYTQIKATGMCHKAAKPPYGTEVGDCPVVWPDGKPEKKEENGHHDHDDHDDHDHGHGHHEEEKKTTTEAPVEDNADSSDETAGALRTLPAAFLSAALLLRLVF